MASRNPPPTYEETLGRGGQPRASPSNFASWGGRGSGTRGPAGSDYRSAGGRVAVPEDVSGDVAGSLRSGGFKVVLYPSHRGKPEERLAGLDSDVLSLRNSDASRSGNVLSFMHKKSVQYQLKSLMEIKLGVPAGEIWSPRTSNAGGAVVVTRRLSDHVPNPETTIRMRFAKDTVDLAAYSHAETIALFDILSQKLPRRNTRTVTPAGVPPPLPHRTNPSPSPVVSVGGEGAGAGVMVRAGNGRRGNGTLKKNAYTNSFDGSSMPDDLDDSFKPPPSVGGRLAGTGGSKRGKMPNGGAKRQRSNLKAMIEQEVHYVDARNAFLADPTLDNGIDAAAAALRPHTLAEVSGAIPQTPSCYVPRVDDLTRLGDALVPDWGTGKIGGATTVIFDPVANGKSVLAAAAMQDPRVQDVFSGGVIWLRAGHAAAGRLLRMMELAVCQLTEEIERTRPGSISRVPERFSDVGAASDYLASMLVRTSSGGGLRETLLVLDDVWEASVAEAFERVGLSLLVTTREPLIARLATPSPSGQPRLIGPLGPLSAVEATAAAAKAAATRRAPPKEAKLLLDRTGRCPLAVGVVGSTLKQAQSPMEWTATSAKVHKTFHGLQRARDMGAGEEEEEEDRITASIAAGLSNMPEENQMLYSALCILPPGLPVTCRLLEQVWETGKRTTILAAEAFEHRRLLDRLGPGNFVLHYEAARFLQHQAGFAGEGAWVGCKLRGQGRELAFNRLCKHLDSFDTLRDHLEKRDLWGLTELWQTCEVEAEKTSGHSHVSCRIYESRLDLLRQEAIIEAGPMSKARTSKNAAKKAYEATLDLAQALNMVADYQAYGGCCDAAPLYSESIKSLQLALEFVAVMGERGSAGAGALESRVKRALERISGKLGAHFLKLGRERDALNPCMESLSLLRARQGTDNSDGMGRNGRGLLPHQDVVDSLLSMAEALIISKRVEEGEGMFEEAAITLRRLYGEDASLCLEARATERLAEMMLDADRAERAYELNERCLAEANSAFGDVHPAIARVLDQKGQILLALKDLEAAALWFSESRQMRETFYGKGHALVAPSLENQALLEINVGNVREAERLLMECLSIQQDRYGPEDGRVKATMAKLQECRAICADEQSPDRGGGATDNDMVDVPRNYQRPAPRVGGGGNSARELGPASPAGGGVAGGGQLGGGGGEMETDEARLKRELVEAEALDDGGREAAAAQGRLAKHLRDKGPSRLVDAEEAYSNWVKKLQSEVDGQRAGTDAELRASILDYIVVLEEQDKDSSDPMFELLRIDKRVFGNDAPEYGDDMERVGRYLASQQTYGQAEFLLKKALVLKEKNGGKDHPEAAGILRAIGRVLFEMKALKDAGDAFDRALAIDNRGDSPADVIEDMRSLGMVYCRQGVYEKAEVMYRKVVEMDRKFRGGEEDPSVITEMNVYAVLLYAQGKMDQAEPLLRRVLALREKVLGHDHVDAAESLVNLAVLNNRKGMYDEALPRLNRALAILRQAHGDLHPETVACWSWIAETHQKQGQYSESEEILMQVVALNRQILGDDHPGVADSLSDLAELRRAQGKLDEAEDSHLEALRIREDYFGPDHDTVAQSAQMLSLLLQSSGREDEAQKYGHRVVEIREKLHEAGVRYASSRNNAVAAPQEHGENARRNHARVAVEKSITRLR